MDESWLDETHPDKIEMKFSSGFRFLFLLCAFYFEFQISVLGLPLIFRVFQPRSLSTVANIFFSCLN